MLSHSGILYQQEVVIASNMMGVITAIGVASGKNKIEG